MGGGVKIIYTVTLKDIIVICNIYPGDLLEYVTGDLLN